MDNAQNVCTAQARKENEIESIELKPVCDRKELEELKEEVQFILEESQHSRLKTICKKMEKAKVPQEFVEEIFNSLAEWLSLLETENFGNALRPIITLLCKSGLENRLSETFFKSASREELCTNPDTRRALKNMFDKLEKASDFTSMWESHLKDTNTKIHPAIAEWVRERARKGRLSEKQKWERLRNLFTHPLTTTITGYTDCIINAPNAFWQEGFP